MGNENFTAAPSGTFRTATGPLNIAANEQKQYRTLCDLIGRPDLKTDPRFAKREARKMNRGALSDELNAALSCRPAEEWEALLNAVGVPAGCVLTVPQVLREPQLLERGFVETLALALHLHRSAHARLYRRRASRWRGGGLMPLTIVLRACPRYAEQPRRT